MSWFNLNSFWIGFNSSTILIGIIWVFVDLFDRIKKLEKQELVEARE